MRSRAFSVLLATAALVGGVTLGATPAQAAGEDCPSDFVCLYEDTGYNGLRHDFRGRLGAIQLNAVLNGMANDRTSSIVNNTNLVERFYQNYDQGGKYIKLYPGWAAADLRRVTIYNADGSYFGVNTFNDRISSFNGSYN
ncbi:peptidase inhibitor family I36 protein [Kitasatospora sp. NPDC052868]|uniref:peptidase inhibitor family I36 protein n=1 Tax=unclassified Kitasatospora TaxID=2633591 RepID=UPI0037C4F646